MKKVKLTTLLILFTILSFSQENPELKVHSFGAGFGFFTSDYDINGICTFLDVTVEYNKNLLSLNYLDGKQLTLGVLGSTPVYHINEFNLQFGRELKIVSWFSIEGFAGVGNYNLDIKSSFYPLPSASAVSIPVRIKLLFYTGKQKHFAMSSNNNYSINKLNSSFSSNLTFQYNF